MWMAKPPAPTVGDYLAGLPEDRRGPIEAVRATILETLPSGFEEGILYGMLAYYVPLSVHPDTYNGQPLLLAALASQKNHMAVYLSAIYAMPELRSWFEAEYRATGKRFDVGKSCVRFRSLDDLPLDLVGEAIAKLDLQTYVSTFETARNEVRSTKATKKPGAKQGSGGAAGSAARKRR